MPPETAVPWVSGLSSFLFPPSRSAWYACHTVHSSTSITPLTDMPSLPVRMLFCTALWGVLTL